jgi:hypothetical protein
MVPADSPELARYVVEAATGASRAEIARRLGKSLSYIDKLRARLKKLAKDLPE